MWKPAFFGVKPETIIKGGFIAAAKMGDANASIPTPQPVIMKNMFGAYGKAIFKTSVTFVSKIAYENNIKDKLGLQKNILPVSRCRTVGKKDMILNDITPKIEVNSDTYEVKVDGVIADCEPVDRLPLSKRYFLF